MKLTLNRTEETSGLVFKKPVYILTVKLEFTDEELQLIKKHKWQGALSFCQDSTVEEIRFSDIQHLKSDGNTERSPRFKYVENLVFFQNGLIEQAKILKSNLANVVDLTSGGPSEVEL